MKWLGSTLGLETRSSDLMRWAEVVRSNSDMSLGLQIMETYQRNYQKLIMKGEEPRRTNASSANKGT